MNITYCLHAQNIRYSKILTVHHICSHKLGVEVASWNHHPIMKICNENLVEEEYRLLLACSEYKIICKKHDDLLDGHDNLSVI